MTGGTVRLQKGPGPENVYDVIRSHKKFSSTRTSGTVLLQTIQIEVSGVLGIQLKVNGVLDIQLEVNGVLDIQLEVSGVLDIQKVVCLLFR